MTETSAAARTPLYALNAALGGKFVVFAGYDMPVQFKAGILAEHLHTRQAAGLFDVSHMGQAILRAEGGHEAVARVFETLVPGDILGLKPGQTRYTLLLNETGGIRDDLMVTRPAEEEGDGCLFLVVNAATKEADFAHIAGALRGKAALHVLEDAALLALQGPQAHRVLARIAPDAEKLKFMHGARLPVSGVLCHVTRSGYTGEDGFEISMAGRHAESIAKALLAEPEVKPIGLGARDSLRLEAGLCLYGHDIDETTSPIEAGLAWTIGKRRKMAGDFPGAHRIMEELFHGAPRKRVGIRPEGKAPAREGTPIMGKIGHVIGKVTSGGFGPSVGGPIAMGYVEPALGDDGMAVDLLIRGEPRPAYVAPLPFIPHRYARTGAQS
jgi:glycine cleavage system T protein (aminomethyltransferase)